MEHATCYLGSSTADISVPVKGVRELLRSEEGDGGATVPPPVQVASVNFGMKGWSRSGGCIESGGQQELLKLQRRGYVVNQGTKDDQEVVNRYYYFCRTQNFTWVQINPGRNVARIRAEIFGPVQRLDAQARRELKALLPHGSAKDYDSIPTLTHVPNHLVGQVALELLRICEATQRRAEKSPSLQTHQLPPPPTNYAKG